MSQTLMAIHSLLDEAGVHPTDGTMFRRLQTVFRAMQTLNTLNAPTPEQQTEIGRLFHAATNPPGGWDDLTPAAQQATTARAVAFVQTVLRMAESE